MNVTDYIIDTSSSESEAMKKIADRAASAHGTDPVKFILENDQLSPEEAKSFLIKLSQTKKETKEDGNLGELYKGMGYVAGLAKPISFMTTPVTEAIRSVPKYIAENIGDNTSQTPSIDTAAEYKELGPSSRAGLGLLTTDIANAFGIQGSPVAKVTSKDYPKAADFIQGMTNPVSLAGVGADIIAGAKMPMPNIPKVPAISLEAAADYVRSITKDNSLLKDLEKSGKIYEIAKIVQQSPEKYLHQFRPNKVYENIMGKINPPEGSRLLGTGELAKLNNYQNDLIETIPQDKYSIPREELQIAALNELNKTGGLEAGQRSSAENFIKNNIPVDQPDQNKIAQIRSQPTTDSLTGGPALPIDPSVPTVESYIDMMRLRNEEPAGYASKVRRLGNKMMEPAIPGEVSTDIGSKNLAGRAMEKAARIAQEQAMGFMDSGDVSTYSSQNKKISNLLNLRNLVEGNLGGAGGRSPYIPGSAGGTTGWVGSVGKSWDKYVKPTSQEIPSGIANQSGNMLKSGNYVNTASNVVGEFSMKSQLNSFKIPRNTQGASEASDMVISKVRLELGDKAADALIGSHSIQNTSDLLRTYSQARPDIFESNTYGSFDGLIVDPAMKQKAISDLVKNPGSSIQDAQKMQNLIHSGKDPSIGE